jgi:hypothetical protein
MFMLSPDTGPDPLALRVDSRGLSRREAAAARKPILEVDAIHRAIRASIGEFVNERLVLLRNWQHKRLP